MAESQNIEWKESWRDEYLKWICGFANAQGGKMHPWTKCKYQLRCRGCLNWYFITDWHRPKSKHGVRIQSRCSACSVASLI